MQCIHTSLFLTCPLHSGHHRALSSPVRNSGFSLVICLCTVPAVYMSLSVSRCVPPLFPTWCLSVCSLHLCLCALQLGPFFWILHVSINAQYFSDLLHSVWQFLNPSTSLQMTLFSSFLWLSNILLYVCATSSLFLCWWTFRLLPCPDYCKLVNVLMPCFSDILWYSIIRIYFFLLIIWSMRQDLVFTINSSSGLNEGNPSR